MGAGEGKVGKEMSGGGNRKGCCASWHGRVCVCVPPPPLFFFSELGPRASPSSILLGAPFSRAVRGWGCWSWGECMGRKRDVHTRRE